MSIARPEVPEAVHDFVRALDAALGEVLGEALIATYLHGSAVLGGFVDGRSDVDVLFIVDSPSDEEMLHASTRALTSASAQCPGRGVELSVVTPAGARHPGAPWPFLLHMTTDPANAPGNDRVIVGTGRSGHPAIVLHTAVYRLAGLSV